MYVSPEGRPPLVLWHISCGQYPLFSFLLACKPASETCGLLQEYYFLVAAIEQDPHHLKGEVSTAFESMYEDKAVGFKARRLGGLAVG